MCYKFEHYSSLNLKIISFNLFPYTLGTRGFSRVRREFSVLAEACYCNYSVISAEIGLLF